MTWNIASCSLLLLFLHHFFFILSSNTLYNMLHSFNSQYSRVLGVGVLVVTICTSYSSSGQHHLIIYGPDALPSTEPAASTHWRHTLSNMFIYIGNFLAHFYSVFMKFRICCLSGCSGYGNGLDLRSTCRGFDCQQPHCWAAQVVHMHVPSTSEVMTIWHCRNLIDLMQF